LDYYYNDIFDSYFIDNSVSIQLENSDSNIYFNEIIDTETGIEIDSSSVMIIENYIESTDNGIIGKTMEGVVSNNDLKILSGDGVDIEDSGVDVSLNNIDGKTENIFDDFNDGEMVSSQFQTSIDNGFLRLDKGYKENFETEKNGITNIGNGLSSILQNYIYSDSGTDLVLEAPIENDPQPWFVERNQEIHVGKINEPFRSSFIGQYNCNPSHSPFGIGLSLSYTIILIDEFSNHWSIDYSFVPFDPIIYPNAFLPSLLGIPQIDPNILLTGFDIRLDPSQKTLYYFWDGLTPINKIDIITEDLSVWFRDRFLWMENMVPPSLCPEFAGVYNFQNRFGIISQDGYQNPSDCADISCDKIWFGNEFLKEGYLETTSSSIDENLQYKSLKIDFEPGYESSIHVHLYDSNDNQIMEFQNIESDTLDLTSITQKCIKIRITFISNEGWSTILIDNYLLEIIPIGEIRAFNIYGGTPSIDSNVIGNSMSKSFDVSGNSQVDWINTKYRHCRFSVEGSSIVSIKWPMQINLFDSTGDPVVGETISISNIDSDSTNSLITNSNGITDSILLTESIISSTTINFKTPHHIEISGYNSLYYPIQNRTYLSIERSPDTDQDGLLDSDESHQDKIWFDIDSFHSSDPINGYIFSQEDGSLVDEYLPLSQSGNWKLVFNANSLVNIDTLMTIEISDGYNLQSSFITSFTISMDESWYVTNYFTITSNDFIRIKIEESVGNSMVINKIGLIRDSVEEHDLLDPFVKDMDMDNIDDSLEAVGTKWFEAENFPFDTNSIIFYDETSGNSKALRSSNIQNTNTVKIPFNFNPNTYEIRIRAKVGDDPLYDDFSSIITNWNIVGDVEIQSETLTIINDGSKAVSTSNMNYHKIIFDYLISEDTHSNSAVKIEFGNNNYVQIGSLVEGSDIEFQEKNHWYSIKIEQSPSTGISIFRSDINGKFQLIKHIDCNDFSNPIEISTYSISNNNIKISIDNFYLYDKIEDPLTMSNTVLKIEKEDNQQVIHQETISIEGSQYKWYISSEVSFSQAGIHNLYIDNTGFGLNSIVVIDRIVIINVDDGFLNNENNINLNNGNIFSIDVPDGEITKAIFSISNGNPTMSSISGEITDICLSEDYAVFEEKVDSSTYKLRIWDIESNSELSTSITDSAPFNADIDKHLLVYKSTFCQKIMITNIVDFTHYKFQDSNQDSSSPKVSDDKVLWVNSNEIFLVDIDQDNDGIIDFEDKEGYYDEIIDDDDDGSNGDEILNGKNDDGDHYVDLGGKPGEFDVNIDQVYMDDDYDGVYTSTSDVFIHPNLNQPIISPGEQLCAFTESDNVFIHDNPDYGTLDSFDSDFDSLWIDVCNDGIYDTNTLPPDILITSGSLVNFLVGSTGVNIHSFKKCGLAYFDSGTSNDEFDISDAVLLESNPSSFTCSSNADRYMGSGTIQAEDGDIMIPLVDEDIDYNDPNNEYIISTLPGVYSEPCFEGNKIVFENSDNELCLFDISYIASVNSRNNYVSGIDNKAIGSTNNLVFNLKSSSGSDIVIYPNSRITMDDNNLLIKDNSNNHCIYSIGSRFINDIDSSVDQPFDISDNRILYKNNEGDLIVRKSDSSNEEITIFTSTFDDALINNDVIIIATENGGKIFRNNFQLDFYNDGTIDWDYNGLIFVDSQLNNPMIIGDFSNILNNRESNTIPIKYYSTSSNQLTINSIDIEVGFISHPLDYDSDRDQINDYLENDGMFGCDIIEFEDAIDFQEWIDPRTEIEIDYYNSQKQKYDYGEIPFIHQNGISLTTSKDIVNSEGIRDSWVDLKLGPFVESNKYDVLINSEYSDDDNKVKRIDDKIYTTNGEFYSSIDRFDYQDIQNNAELIGYLEDLCKHIFYLEIVRSDGEEIEIDENVYNIDVVKMFFDSNDNGCFSFNEVGLLNKLHICIDIDFHISMYLLEDVEYSIRVGLDLKRMPDELNPMYTGENGLFPNDLEHIFNSLGFVRVLNLDNIRIESKGLDILNDDTDNDGLFDNYEISLNGFPKSSDPDKDGISDRD
jgi:hypothetical protein